MFKISPVLGSLLALALSCATAVASPFEMDQVASPDGVRKLLSNKRVVCDGDSSVTRVDFEVIPADERLNSSYPPMLTPIRAKADRNVPGGVRTESMVLEGLFQIEIRGYGFQYKNLGRERLGVSVSSESLELTHLFLKSGESPGVYCYVRSVSEIKD